MAMSRIRHLVWPMQSDARNSSGDENARTAKPNSFNKSGSDSRTDSSSSTTDTSERVTVIDFSCRPTVAGFGNATPGVFALALVRKSTCPSGSAVHTNPGSALATRLISGLIFSRQCSTTRECATPGDTVYCALVLVCQSEVRNGPQIGTPRCKAEIPQ